MPIKTQKILRLIPFVNLIPLLCLFSAIRKQKASAGKMLMLIFKIIFFIILSVLPRLALHFALQNNTIDCVMYFVTLYLIMFSISCISVAEQEKMMKN